MVCSMFRFTAHLKHNLFIYDILHCMTHSQHQPLNILTFTFCSFCNMPCCVTLHRRNNHSNSSQPQHKALDLRTNSSSRQQHKAHQYSLELWTNSSIQHQHKAHQYSLELRTNSSSRQQHKAHQYSLELWTNSSIQQQHKAYH